MPTRRERERSRVRGRRRPLDQGVWLTHGSLQSILHRKSCQQDDIGCMEGKIRTMVEEDEIWDSEESVSERAASSKREGEEDVL